MNSVENNFSEETIQNLKYLVCCQKAQISELMSKLEVYNEVITDRDNLREIVNEHEQKKENNDVSRKVFTDMLTSFEDQTEKLRKVAAVECNWQTKYDELQQVNDCITDQLKDLKSNEEILKSKLENSEQQIIYVQKEMESVKSEFGETNSAIRKLKANLKSNEEELCKKRRQLDECTNECSKLNETNKILEKDIKCLQLKLNDARSCITCAEEKRRFEIETLSNELRMKCVKLKDLELKYNEVNCKLNDDKCKVKTLVTTLNDLKEASLQNYSEMKNQVQKLKKDNSYKETNLCHLKNNIKQLQRENEFLNMEVNTLKTKLHKKDCQLEEFKMLTQKITKLEASSCLEQSKNNSPIGITSLRNSPSNVCCNISKNISSIIEKYTKNLK